MQQSAQRKYEYSTTAYPARKRVVKMQGNVAYISTDPVGPRPKTQPAAKPAKKVQAKPRAKLKAQQLAKAKAAKEALAKSRRSLAATLFIILAAFCALSLLVSRYALVCSIGGENYAIRQEIAAVEDKIEELKVDMELRDNIEYLQSTAEQKLDMTYPKQDQKITIDMSG